MVICPDNTEPEIIPVDQQELFAFIYKDEWMADLCNLWEKHKPPQK
jgi:hypothetical protein